MAQSWHDLLFAHWPVPTESVRPLIPRELELDCFEGSAWVGVVPFRMTGIRLRGTPALPLVSAFPELNVRTYVRRRDGNDAKPGVYFFSLDAAHRLAVRVARAVYHLPYFFAQMSCRIEGDGIRYASRRRHQGAAPAEFVARYAPCGDCCPAAPGGIEHWLVERYRLYTAHRGRLFAGDIHHIPWPLQPAQAEIEGNTMASASGIVLPDTAPLLHFARRLDTLIWPLRLLG